MDSPLLLLLVLPLVLATSCKCLSQRTPAAQWYTSSGRMTPSSSAAVSLSPAFLKACAVENLTAQR